MKLLKLWATALSLVAVSGAAQAALFDRGGGLIYDSTRNLTWLADMNYAQTSGHDSDGLMTWAEATAWAEGLSYGGYGDWRLPTLNPLDSSCNVDLGLGYNCTDGELSGLFVTDLGNKAGESVLSPAGDSAEQIANLALFSNVKSSVYFSGTEYAPFAGYAWLFYTESGYQAYSGKDNSLFAAAVRPGDVAAVPEPQIGALLMAGLGAVALAMRRRRPR